MEVVSIRSVSQYCLQDLSQNSHRANNLIIWVDSQNVPSASVAWPYNASGDLAQILVGSIRELPFFFYKTYGLHPLNWNIINHGTLSTFSSSWANFPTDGVGSYSSSHTTMPVLTHNMDVLAILDEARVNESASTALSRKVTVKKT